MTQQDQEAAEQTVSRVKITCADWPLSLARAHGRISAYRSTLIDAADAIAVAWPYVANLVSDPNVSPWRRDTAASSLTTLRTARDRIAAELAVTNP